MDLSAKNVVKRPQNDVHDANRFGIALRNVRQVIGQLIKLLANFPISLKRSKF